MAAADFFSIYELVSFCLLPSSWDPERHQIDIDGTFLDGENSPSDGAFGTDVLKKYRNFQFLLNVEAADVELWVHLLLNIKLEHYDNRKVSVNLYQGNILLFICVLY